jgi:hypothetical protein
MTIFASAYLAFHAAIRSATFVMTIPAAANSAVILSANSSSDGSVY